MSLTNVDLFVCVRNRFATAFATRVRIVCCGLLLLHSIWLGAEYACAAGVNTWASATTGNWDAAANWSQNPNVPGTPGQTTDDVVLPASGGHTLTLDNTIMGNLGLSDMTVRSIVGNNSTSFPFRLNVSGTNGNPLVMNVGEVGNNPAYGLRTLRSNVWTFDWVDLNILGSPTTHAWEIERMRSNTQTEHAVMNNTNVSILSPMANNGLYVHADNDNGGFLEMTGGSLTVTNATNNAEVDLGSGNGLNGSDIGNGKIGAKITLNDTALSTNNFEVHNNATFRFNNGGLAGTSTISGQLLIGRAGHVDLVSGNLQIGTINYGPDSSRDYFLGFHPDIDVTGANVTVTTINMTATAAEPGASYQLNINGGGIVSATTTNIGGNTATRGEYQLNLGPNGTFNSTTLNLGRVGSNGAHGAGLLNMTDGTLTAGTVKLGNTTSSQQSADGYWNQTGGDSTITGTIEFNRGREAFSSSNLPQDFDVGTREFRVTQGATMTLTGAGFTMVTLGTLDDGSSDWLLTESDWDVSGTLKFSPGTGVQNQTLLAFGEDVSAPLFGNYDQIAAFVQGNFGVGTLDLTDLNGLEVLTVTGAGNFDTNALYINELLGLTPATVAAHLDSSLNLYYNSSASPSLQGLNYALLSGGNLIAITAVPEPGSFTLMLLGVVGLAYKRRQQKAKYAGV